MSGPTERDGNAWSSRAKWVFGVFAIIGAFFLIAEHRAHVLPFLPWLVLLACPLMHLFMHGGHGRRGGHHGSGDQPRDGSGGSAGATPEASRNGASGPTDPGDPNHGGRP